MRDQRRASLRLIIALTMLVGGWAGTLSAVLGEVIPSAAQMAAN
jgi:hypothetical protein